MLRHSRAITLWENRKHKERDRIHGNHSGNINPKPYYEQDQEDYLNVKNKFNLREYLRKAWDFIY